MDPVNIKEARKRLSDLVDAAERGESVVITRRGRRVARLVPVEPAGGTEPPDLAAFRSSLKVKGKPLSRVVTDGRRQDRY